MYFVKNVVSAKYIVILWLIRRLPVEDGTDTKGGGGSSVLPGFNSPSTALGGAPFDMQLGSSGAVSHISFKS